MKLGNVRQCHITKQLAHSFSVNIRISQPSKVQFTSVNITVLGLTNPDVNLKRTHQLYNITPIVNMPKIIRSLHELKLCVSVSVLSVIS